MSSISFYHFVRLVFGYLSPGDEFIDSWHVEYLCQHLSNAIQETSEKRLLINLPPRSLKSTIISVAWPAWLLGHQPNLRIIVASYARALSIKHAEDTRTVMQSTWYQQLFPNLVLDKTTNTKYKFKTTAHGFRIATSVMGTLTGEGADILIADDPQTPLQAHSKAIRQRVNQWFDQTFSTRLNNKKRGIIVVVMQRLSSADLSAYILQKQIYLHIALPIIAEWQQTYSTNGFCYERAKGELLCNALDDITTLTALKKEIGNYAFQAQYMQQPYQQNSSVLQLKWLQYYDFCPEDIALVFQSWDVAASISDGADYSVCITCYNYQGKLYLANIWRSKCLYHELRKQAWEQYRLYKPCYVLIENKSSGTALLQELSQEYMPVKSITPKVDKVTRVLRVSGFIESGRLCVPRHADWLSAFEYEYSNFPYAEHDDQVDALSQLIQWYLDNIQQNIGRIRQL